MTKTWKNGVYLATAILALAGMLALGAEKYGKPKSILHVVTLYYKPATTEQQKQAVLSGIEKMAAEIPGIKNIWLKAVKVQGEYLEKGADKPTRYTDAFVIEFEDEEAFEKYAEHPSHKDWEKLYLPIRGRSTTHDITN
jgi:hypothetical protein